MLLHLPRLEGHGTTPRVKNGPALAGHGAEAVRDAIAMSIRQLPEHLRKTLTWDQGAEMAQHAQLRIDAGIAIYFCDPQSPRQRGTNENTNGLLRQYFPKGTDLSRAQRRRTRRGRRHAQQPTAQDPWLENSGRSARRTARSVQEGSVATTP
jgi:IS30 family transposase